MTHWAAQIYGLSHIKPRFPLGAHACIRTSNEGQAISREAEIVKLLAEGTLDAYKIAEKMNWTVGGTRRRLNIMTKKGSIKMLSTWPRTWTVA